jgi:hypothetical protein
MRRMTISCLQLRWGRFKRVFHLPPDAQEDDIRADFTNGVLTLTIAKKTPQVLQTRGRRIEIGSDTLEGRRAAHYALFQVFAFLQLE